MNLDKKRSSIKISNLKSQIRFGAALGLFGALTAFGSAAFAQRYIFGRLDVATGVAPQSVAAGDFNGDGKLDVAVVNQNDGTVSILLGKPDATFLPRVDVAVGPAPVHGVVADLNGDGKLDLAVVASGGDSVSILLGNGDGTFQPHVD